jgi:regulator of sigma E protease
MFITIIVFILILGLLVFVHEFGHFYAAKKAGMDVEEFGIGFPPKMYSKKYKGTEYSLNLIPLGGFVKIKGEDEEIEGDEDSFSNKPIWRRLSVIVAGVTMNALTGWFLLSALFLFGAPVEITPDIDEKYIKEKNIVIAEVIQDSPAAIAGLLAGDKILKVENNFLDNIESFQLAMEASKDEETEITYKRGETESVVSITPKIIENIQPDRAIIGIAPTEIGIVKFPIHKAIVAGAQSGYNYSKRILEVLGNIFKDVWNRQPVAQSVGGPVAVAVITGDMLDMGFSHLIIFIAVLSLNFAVINIMPFPALDGGRLIFLIAEKIRGKPSRQVIEAWFHRVGFLLLMLLMIVVTYRDIARFGGRIWHAVVG